MILGKSASIISKIHSMALVYGDVSANNIFYIADDDQKFTVWLIDADNLSYEKKKGIVVYTPEYGAPELVQKDQNGNPVRGISSWSDCYAFSVLAHRVLTWVHPFLGNFITNPNSDEDTWGSKLGELSIEEKAYAGYLPYIDDPINRDNEETINNKIFPRKYFLLPTLQKIFQITFSEKGRNRSFSRISMYHWTRALVQAHDLTYKCKKCGMTLYRTDLNNSYVCDACDEDNSNIKALYIESYLLTKQGKLKTPEWKWIKEILNTNNENDVIFNIPERVFLPFNNDSFDETYLRVTFDQKQNTMIFKKDFFKNDSKLFYAIKNKNPNFVQLSQTKLEINLENLTKKENVWFLCVSSLGYCRLISVCVG